MDVVTRTDPYDTTLTVISKPSFGYQGIIPDDPFIFNIEINDPEYENYKLSIYADGSRSLPYTEDSTTIWSHLKPRWRFLDRSQNLIDYYAPIKFTTRIVDENGITTGAIGEVRLYYVDDLPTTFVEGELPTLVNKPVLLWFSIGDRTESEIKTVISYIVKPLKPEFLKVTNDGSTKMLDLYNAGANIQAYFTIHANFNGQTPIIYDIPNRYNPHIYGNRALGDILVIDEITSGNINDIDIDITFSMSSPVAANTYALVSSGTQYIDIGFPLLDTYDFEYEVSVPDELTDKHFFGVTQTVGSIYRFKPVYFEVFPLANSMASAWGSWVGSLSPALDWSPNQYYVNSKVNDTVYSTGLEGTASRFLIAPIPPTTLVNAYLFGYNDASNDGVPVNLTACTIKSLKIWSDATRTTLLRNMWAVPAGMVADGASVPAPSNCMYDSVNDEYLENQGTGVFTVEVL